MSLYRSLPNVEKPISALDETLTKQGFAKVEKDDHFVYQADFYDASCERRHRLLIPVESGEGKDKVRLGQAYFESGESGLPSSVIAAAASKLSDIADYCR